MSRPVYALFSGLFRSGLSFTSLPFLNPISHLLKHLYKALRITLVHFPSAVFSSHALTVFFGQCHALKSYYRVNSVYSINVLYRTVTLICSFNYHEVCFRTFVSNRFSGLIVFTEIEFFCSFLAVKFYHHHDSR